MTAKEKNIYSFWTLAWKTVTRKMFRNIVLILAVSMLVSLLVFAMLFNRVIKDDINAATQKLGADIVLVPVEALELAEEFILESNEKTFYMDESVFDAVMDLPEIKQATYHVYLSTLESSCCSIVEGQVVAIDHENDFVIRPWLDTEAKLKPGEVFVGSYVHEYLGMIDAASLFGSPVKVVGHLKETGTGLDHGIFMRKDDLDNISVEATGQRKKSDISIIFLKLKEGVDLIDALASIKSVNPHVGIMTRGSIGKDVRATLKDIIRIFTITILIASALAVLLAWSTFTALANERQREVGILRAIGAHRKHILNMFMSEALIISLIGGLLGIVLGHILLQILAADFNLMAKLGIKSSFSLMSILLSFTAMLLGGGVCLVGALIPIRRLAKMEPLLAIKEE
ncbi:MAG: ABC transporter permease [Proteobacteria bacterium]|nr:ABC transporter permease [Pseudomonadota bacterium]MBU1714759.1 ABC transporter permease [Pseudomonadota bacterium]